MILTLLIMCMSTTVFANENKYFFTESNGVISWQLKKFSDGEYKPYTGEQISRYILRIYYENQQIPSYKDEYYKTNSFEFQKTFDSLGRVSGHYTIFLQAKDINDNFITIDTSDDLYEFDYKNNSHIDNPTNLRWDGKIAKWDDVKNAKEYEIFLQGYQTSKTSDPYYDFSILTDACPAVGNTCGRGNGYCPVFHPWR